MSEAPKVARPAKLPRRGYESPRLIKHDKLARLTAMASVSAMKPVR